MYLVHEFFCDFVYNFDIGTKIGVKKHMCKAGSQKINHVVKTDQPDHVQVVSDRPVPLMTIELPLTRQGSCEGQYMYCHKCLLEREASRFSNKRVLSNAHNATDGSGVLMVLLCTRKLVETAAKTLPS